MTTTDLLTIVIGTFVIVVSMLIGSKVVGPSGLHARVLSPVGLLVTAVITLAVALGAWQSSDGDWASPVKLYFTVLLWVAAMFYVFRRPRDV